MLKVPSQISLRYFLLGTVLVGASIGIAGSYWRASVYQPLRITGTWSGEVPNEAASRAIIAQARESKGGKWEPLDWLDYDFPKVEDPLNAPHISLVCDSDTWDAVWKAWHGGDAPQVDFQREFIIVVKGEGPNTLRVETLTRNGTGDAKMVCWVTQLYGPGFCYLFLKAPRPEIRTMDGKPVPTIDHRMTRK